jgi:hypothetical protein
MSASPRTADFTPAGCQTVPQANLAERQEWRDHRLMALANHIAETDNALGT